MRSFGRQKDDQQRIDLTGIATNGGMDGNDMRYWVGNMFSSYSLKAYCSEENKNNIVCAAVLSCLLQQEVSPQLALARKTLADELRRNEKLRTALPTLPSADSEAPFSEMEHTITLNMFPRLLELLVSDVTDVPEKRAKASALMQHYLVLKASSLTLNDVLPDPSDCFHLERKIDKESIHSAKTFFWTRHILVSREGQYTCPLETFMVFVSMEFIPLESDAFNRFNNLRESSDLIAFSQSSGLEIIHSQFNQNGCSYHEFQRIHSPLQPVLWGKFTSREGTRLEVDLHDCFVGKYFYVKLINPENRMREMHDQHEFTNIDVKEAAAGGFLETLS